MGQTLLTDESVSMREERNHSTWTGIGLEKKKDHFIDKYNDTVHQSSGA